MMLHIILSLSSLQSSVVCIINVLMFIWAGTEVQGTWVTSSEFPTGSLVRLDLTADPLNPNQVWFHHASAASIFCNVQDEPFLQIPL